MPRPVPMEVDPTRVGKVAHVEPPRATSRRSNRCRPQRSRYADFCLLASTPPAVDATPPGTHQVRLGRPGGGALREGGRAILRGQPSVPVLGVVALGRGRVYRPQCEDNIFQTSPCRLAAAGLLLGNRISPSWTPRPPAIRLPAPRLPKGGMSSRAVSGDPLRNVTQNNVRFTQS